MSKTKVKVKLTILYTSKYSYTYSFNVDTQKEAECIKKKLFCDFKKGDDLRLTTNITTILISRESYIGLKIQVD